MDEYLVCIKIKTNTDVEQLFDTIFKDWIDAGDVEEAEVVKVEKCI